MIVVRRKSVWHLLVLVVILATTFVSCSRRPILENEAEGLTLEDFEAASQIGKVQIDIKPGGFPNTIDLNANDILIVAVLTTEVFDATSIDTSDLARIEFGDVNRSVRVSPVRSTVEDVDGDGDTDLILHFSIPELREEGALEEGTTEARIGVIITRPTFGAYVWGADSVQIVSGD